VHIQRAESLLPFNSLALQASADALVTVNSALELRDACSWAREHEFAVVPLGQGSNVVLAADLTALVIRQCSRGIEQIAETPASVTLRVAAGEDWHSLVQWSLQQHLYGLENLALIPGTVGAAPIQNIGAYGVELKSFVTKVHAVSIASGETISLSNAECAFAYRDSVFKRALQDQLIISAVELTLSRVPEVHIEYPALQAAFSNSSSQQVTPQAVFDAVVAIRSSKLPDPAVMPNAGSFFKNPCVTQAQAVELAARFPELPVYPQPDGQAKLAAAWMIEYCGWKGYRGDGLGIHPEHALVMVNYGNGNGVQLLELASRVRDSVADTFAVVLQIEPRVYG